MLKNAFLARFEAFLASKAAHFCPKNGLKSLILSSKRLKKGSKRANFGVLFCRSPKTPLHFLRYPKLFGGHPKPT